MNVRAVETRDMVEHSGLEERGRRSSVVRTREILCFQGTFHLCLKPRHDFLRRLDLAAPAIYDHLPAGDFLHAWEYLLRVASLHLVVREILVWLSARHDLVDGRA